MTEAMGYVIMLFVGVVIGVKFCNNYHNGGKIQQMRNEKTTSYLVTQKESELAVN